MCDIFPRGKELSPFLRYCNILTLKETQTFGTKPFQFHCFLLYSIIVTSIVLLISSPVGMLLWAEKLSGTIFVNINVLQLAVMLDK